MLTHRLAQALLLAVSATVVLWGGVGIAHAAEGCRSKPGPTAPSGSRWLYRINRADHRHCWFLSSKAVSAHSQPSRRHRHLAGEPDALQQDQQQNGRNLKARSAPASETDVAEVAEPPTAPQVGAPSVDLSPEYFVAHSVPTVVYKLPPPGAQMVSKPTAVVAPTVAPESAGASKSKVVLLAGTAALGLLFAGGACHAIRHIHLRSRTGVIADRGKGPVAVRSSVATKPSPMMADRAEGRNTSLRKLGHHRKPNLQACNSEGSSGVISLPPAAAWLTRPKVRLRADELADA
jgi:hypothetical protein